jgi:hypothetical protein
LRSSASQSARPAASRPILFALLGILLVIGVRLNFIRQTNFCGVPDSCSYLSLAQTLSTRHIFQANYADNLQLEHVALPATGIEYWRPGTSFFLLLARPLGQITLHSSLVVTLLAGLLMALAAWRIVMQFNQDRSLAAHSVLLAFILPAVWDSSLIADSGLFYAAAVAWFLALFTVRSQGYLADILALVCVAIAYMVRNDAAILIVPLLVVLLLRYRARQPKPPQSGRDPDFRPSESIHLESRRTESSPVRGSSAAYCALILLGFFLAFVPMHLIDLLVLGKAFPGSTSRVLYFNDLSDLSRYGSLVNLHSWLSVGMGRLVKLRIATLPLILYRIFFIVIGVGLIFVPLLFLRRRDDGSRTKMPEIAGGLTFFATLLAVYGILLPAIGVFSALRTSFGLLPLVAVLILVAIRNFLPPQAARVLSAAVIVYYLVFGIMYARRTLTDQTKDGDQMRLHGAFLHAQGVGTSTARLITDDPDQMYVTNGYPAIQLPVNGAPAIAQLASDLHATHVLLDTSAHDLSVDELRNSLHPIAISAMPNSTLILLTLPAAPLR